MKGTEPLMGEYISFQVINDVPADGRVWLGIVLPLIQKQGSTEKELVTFNFEVKNVPVGSNEPGSYPQTYVTKVNGLSMQLTGFGQRKLKPGCASATTCLQPIWTGSQCWLRSSMLT